MGYKFIAKGVIDLAMFLVGTCFDFFIMFNHLGKLVPGFATEIEDGGVAGSWGVGGWVP